VVVGKVSGILNGQPTVREEAEVMADIMQRKQASVKLLGLTFNSNGVRYNQLGGDIYGVRWLAQ